MEGSLEIAFGISNVDFIHRIHSAGQINEELRVVEDAIRNTLDTMRANPRIAATLKIGIEPTVQRLSLLQFASRAMEMGRHPSSWQFAGIVNEEQVEQSKAQGIDMITSPRYAVGPGGIFQEPVSYGWTLKYGD